MRNVAYRADSRDLGQAVTVSGEIRKTTISDASLEIEKLRHQNDGVSRTLDFGDGTAAITAKLVDPHFEINVGDWCSGDYRVPYSVGFLEVD